MDKTLSVFDHEAHVTRVQLPPIGPSEVGATFGVDAALLDDSQLPFLVTLAAAAAAGGGVGGGDGGAMTSTGVGTSGGGGYAAAYQNREAEEKLDASAEVSMGAESVGTATPPPTPPAKATGGPLDALDAKAMPPMPGSPVGGGGLAPLSNNLMTTQRIDPMALTINVDEAKEDGASSGGLAPLGSSPRLEPMTSPTTLSPSVRGGAAEGGGPNTFDTSLQLSVGEESQSQSFLEEVSACLKLL